jgi:hypothetical protein
MSARDTISEAATEHGWELKEVRRHAPTIEMRKDGIRILVTFTYTGRVHGADRFRGDGCIEGFIAPRESGKAGRVLSWLCTGGVR